MAKRMSQSSHRKGCWTSFLDANRRTTAKPERHMQATATLSTKGPSSSLGLGAAPWVSMFDLSCFLMVWTGELWSWTCEVKAGCKTMIYVDKETGRRIEHRPAENY